MTLAVQCRADSPKYFGREGFDLVRQQSKHFRIGVLLLVGAVALSSCWLIRDYRASMSRLLHGIGPMCLAISSKDLDVYKRQALPSIRSLISLNCLPTSSTHKENPLYIVAEHLLVGISTRYGIACTIKRPDEARLCERIYRRCCI